MHVLSIKIYIFLPSRILLARVDDRPLNFRSGAVQDGERTASPAAEDKVAVLDRNLGERFCKWCDVLALRYLGIVSRSRRPEELDLGVLQPHLSCPVEEPRVGRRNCADERVVDEDASRENVH